MYADVQVHMLRESRGAILEVVVSRMKSITSGLRFLALSATVPNVEDVAEYGHSYRDSTNPGQVAWCRSRLSLGSSSRVAIWRRISTCTN